jgi:hypothetical protein
VSHCSVAQRKRAARRPADGAIRRRIALLGESCAGDESESGGESDERSGFLMRGLANVRAEFSLTALAYNLRRALNILGVEAMRAAVVA